MGKKLTLILGGARSGKSSYAERFASERSHQVLYIATAQAWDDEMAERIANHRAQRPSGWQTLESPIQVGSALSAFLHEHANVDLILLDCLTLLANNVLITLPEDSSEATATAALMAEVDALLRVYAKHDCDLIIVSNEVGLGIVPPYPLGRLYRDALGRANQQLAAAADEVLFMVAGLPLVVKGER
ncbi:MAG: bifunctional adenosylcobinamide kinase/adenosylcobinamide-phosphate guanylyltransferase [Caldilineaceae bacterium]|nr:bifunctional adenosylcobinamide kinase/adenosylcobinamide-phosphate guanylyltransferase [Caldilineaceae bacterium]